MVVYHVYNGGQDAVRIVELSVSRPRTKVLNTRTGKTYWVANTHIVTIDQSSSVLATAGLMACELATQAESRVRAMNAVKAVA
jgi:hypothetical protein